MARAFTCSQSLPSPNKSHILCEVACEEIVRHVSWQAKMLTFIQETKAGGANVRIAGLKEGIKLWKQVKCLLNSRG